MLSKEGVEPSRPASNSKQQRQQQQRARRSSDSSDQDLQEREEGTAVSSTPHRLYLGDSSSQPRRADVERSLPQATEADPATDVVATAEGTSELRVNLAENMENGRAAAAAAAAAAATTSAATAPVLDNPDAGDCGHADGEDWFDVDKDTAVTDFKYDYKEAICLDLSRAGGVAAVATQSTPGAAAPAVDVAGPSRKGGAAHDMVNVSQTTNATTDTDTNIITNTGGGETSGRAPANPSQNPMDMSIRGKYEMRRFTAAVAAAATATATPAAAAAAADSANNPAPAVAGLSRRKAPMTPAVRYLMEAMCTDLQCCGECFVPHFRASQTLVRFCGFVPFEEDEGLDEETRRFIEGENAHGADARGNAAGGEAYGRGIGLPGIAWASSRASLVEISTLTSDVSFDCGGVRLAQAGQLFHTALTVPLYFTSTANNTNINGLWEQQQLMGVVVVYFRAPRKAASASALVRYASAVAKSAAPMSELMVHRARFVVGRAHRTQRGWRVLVIALRFVMPMLVRYHKLTGRSLIEGATASADDFGFTAATAAVMAEMSASRHKLRAETTNRAMMVVNQPGGGASGVRGTKAWLSQYLAKAKGGPVNLPPRANPRDAFVTWFGTFAAIGSLELVYDGINRSPRLWGAQEDMFILSGSFGALATILFAIPGAPLAQPRIVLSAHALAIAVSLVAISVFQAGRAVWLQNSVTVASAILGMSLTRIVHPPAGALCLVLLGAHNKGATWERMLMLVASVVMGLVVHIAVGVGINNISPRRGYPVFW